MVHVYGPTVDDQTRCIHYSTDLDVVAMEFHCCSKFYPCYLCHDESEDHPRTMWPRDSFDSPAVLCGVCITQISIADYLNVTECPQCSAAFNPGCRLHSHLYFDTSTT
ncbi:CHY zinc finger protein [Rhodococcoides kyotonense]|nr:CHY zinc finger protein [Rhodococcus kyotonensis]